MSPIVASYVGKIDSRILVSFGVLWLAGVGLIRSGLASNASYWVGSLPFVAQGLAMPFFFIPTNQLALSSVLPEETAAAAGLSNFMRTTSAAFATSLITTNWENAATRNRANMVGAINDPTGLMNKLNTAGRTAAQALAQIEGITQGQAVMLATDQMFLITSVVFVLAAGVMWLAPKPEAGAPPMMGGH